ncbi:MAG TPA: hypothetical protein VLV56_06415 [Burkholderiales bacterium]|nr:hypothetical protein [Burkholderiales bacterium]
MSEPEDLLGKADAFLKRYHPSSAPGRHDVPVLTEVIEEGREAPPGPPAAAAQNAATRPDVAEMEQRLKQSILDAVASYVTKSVEEPLRAHLEAHLQTALAALSAQLKSDLETLIRETVARAVAAEITRLRGPSRGS